MDLRHFKFSLGPKRGCRILGWGMGDCGLRISDFVVDVDSFYFWGVRVSACLILLA